MISSIGMKNEPKACGAGKDMVSTIELVGFLGLRQE